MNTELLVEWTEVKKLVEVLDLDIHKNVAGNVSSGIRVRRGLRAVRKGITALIRETIKRDSEQKKLRKQRREEKKNEAKAE